MRGARLRDYELHLVSRTLLTTCLPAAPQSANFGSGPTKKRPGHSLNALSDAPLGRSHRAQIGKDKLQQAIDDTRRILGVPAVRSLPALACSR